MTSKAKTTARIVETNKALDELDKAEDLIHKAKFRLHSLFASLTMESRGEDKQEGVKE